jgi:hypothetical protein
MADDINVHVKMFDEAQEFERGAQEGGGAAVQRQVRVAEIAIEFAEFDASLARDQELRKELQAFLQQMAEDRFGPGAVIVSVELRGGSLIVTAVVATGVAAYKFFRDYPQLHNGVKVFAEDVKKAKKKIEAIIRKHKK